MDMHAYQNSFINTVFETKKANPISLSIIYMVVCQSLKIPVYGVNVPQNFIVAYMGGMISDLKLIGKDDVQFYLNPFNKGAVFTHREVELFLSQIKIEHDDKYFVPCDNVTIINRVLNNLIFAFEKSGEPDKSKAFKRLKTALE
jgi:regulator of sirC expression with transglutaminase-like and TPR domain